ncbi:MAG: hypothetical protein ASARMPRED_002632 [Alectoria sarmentosa]|nr:MAG: hypothetical protein ASARMPRED_002632 [Alectoria sarmentosa]
MSGTFDRSTFDDPSHHHPNNNHRQYSLTPPSRPSTSGKSDTRVAQVKKTLGKDVRVNLSTPNSTDRETSGTSLHLSSDTHAVLGESNDEVSSNAHDSPEGQLVAGPPGIARRAKAHVPSACVNCKKKHLACETKRPCSRCVQTGKEASCVDVQHKKRGRPRLREEDNVREMAFGTEYPHNELYSSQAGGLSDPHSGRRRSKTYRELRSQPETPFVDQRPRTSDPTFSQQQYIQGATSYPVSPPTSHFINHDIPTVLLTLDFVVAQHNSAFSNALSLSFTARAQTLLDLVVPAEREKIQRLQSIMRAELREAPHSSLMRGGQSSNGSTPSIEHLDIARTTAGFRTRSEYWTFRLPREQSRGFPISISLAKEGAHFVVLTLVQSTSAMHAVQTPPLQQLVRNPPILQSSVRGYQSPPQRILPHHSHNRGQHRNSPSDVAIPYVLASPTSSLDEQMLQLQPSHSLAQYKHSSPPRPVAYSTARTNSGSSGSSDIPRSSPGQPLRQDSLRHLQLPPIRTAPTSDPLGGKDPMRRKGSESTPSPGRSSPQSAHGGKRKKRRRVDIGEMLH